MVQKGVRLYDTDRLTSYEVYTEDSCKDKTDRSVFRSVMQYREVITMGKVVGRPITNWEDSARPLLPSERHGYSGHPLRPVQPLEA